MVSPGLLLAEERVAVVQGDQLNMAVRFWYLVKIDLSSVLYCSVAFTKVPEQHGHVYLVWLYVAVTIIYRCFDFIRKIRKFYSTLQGKLCNFQKK